MFASPLFPASIFMHIPDGFLRLGVAAVCWLVTLAVVGVALRRTQAELTDRQIPLMGVMAAFIFAAQMINFPVAGGTSGHLVGGALAAMILGPWAAILVMTAVIAVQALLFQDGGLLVMGANILNMGIVPALIGYGLYRPVTVAAPQWRRLTAGVAAWFAVEIAALLASLELWLSGTAALRLVLPAMLGVHALIGIGEALITVAALSMIHRLRPELGQSTTVQARGGQAWMWGGLAAALAFVLFAPWASTHPDGLERVAADLGFSTLERGQPIHLLQGYTLPGVSAAWGTTAAGVLGLVAVLLVVIIVLVLLRRMRRLA